MEIGIPMTACVKGRLYKCNARNFYVGVYDGNQGFIGIRTKFGRRFLETEYHWDQGPPHGTVRGVEDTGIDCPADIPLVDCKASNPGLFQWLEQYENL